MCTALQNLNFLDEEGTERGRSKVATALHRTLWAATGRFGGAWSASRMFSERESVYLFGKQHNGVDWAQQTSSARHQAHLGASRTNIRKCATISESSHN